MFMMFSWNHPGRTPVLVGHRGCPARAPENTLASFRLAVREGSAAIELDLRCSADGVPIVIHDATLLRTTGAHGRPEGRTYAALRRLSAGSWFGAGFRSETIPALGEVLAFCGGKTGINIELKAPRREAAARSLLLRQCAAELAHIRFRPSILVSSFDEQAITEFRRLVPDIPTGFLYHPIRHFRRSPAALAARCGAGWFIANIRAMTPRLAQRVRHHGLRLGLYTVNNRRTLQRALRLQADAVYTDSPADLVPFLNKHKSP